MYHSGSAAHASWFSPLLGLSKVARPTGSERNSRRRPSAAPPAYYVRPRRLPGAARREGGQGAHNYGPCRLPPLWPDYRPVQHARKAWRLAGDSEACRSRARVGCQRRTLRAAATASEGDAQVHARESSSTTTHGCQPCVRAQTARQDPLSSDPMRYFGNIGLGHQSKFGATASRKGR